MKKNLLFLVLFISILFITNAQPGSVDLTFNSTDIGNGYGDGLDGNLYTIIRQSDGKIILGGTFKKYHGSTVNYVTRVNPDGSLDNSFQTGTTVLANVLNLALQSDGKIIVVGNFDNFNGVSRNRIIRLNSDGTVDLTFNPGTGADAYISKAEIQSDGKIIIAGGFTAFNGVSVSRIARLNSDGSVDNTFTTGTGFDNSVNSITIQSDGKILLGGGFTTFNGNSTNYICRLNSNGTIDNTFITGTGFDSYIYTIKLQSDGKILVGGNFNFYNGVDKYYLARLDTNGSLDTTFLSGTGPNSGVSNILVDNDKFFIYGSISSYNGVAASNLSRINSDGTMDNTFSAGTGVGGGLSSICVLPDGKYLIGGSFTNYNSIPRGRFARINSNGSLDEAFLPGSGANSSVYSTAVASDGKIVITGHFTMYNGAKRQYLTFLNSDGTNDTGFNPSASANQEVFTSAFQSDGKIIIGGMFQAYGSVPKARFARILRDGDSDWTHTIGTGASNHVRSCVVQPNNKTILTGNFTNYQGFSRSGITRVNIDGDIDLEFTPGNGATLGLVQSVALQSDGKILIGGTFTFYNSVARRRIARLDTNGVLDASFTPFLGASDTVYTIVVQSDNKIVIGGSFTSYNGTTVSKIARLNVNGSIDSTYMFGSGANGTILDAIIQSNDKVIIVGNFTSYNGTPCNRIARINTDGSLDPTFNIGTGANATIKSISLQSDGNIIIGGDFTSFNGVGRNRLARIIGGENPIVINTGALTSNNLCQGATISVPFTISSLTNSPNTFVAQLSDASGNFSSPINIGSLISNTSGSINAVIPINQTLGVGYRIRVVSTNPVVIGLNNGTDVKIKGSTSSTISVSKCNSYTAPDGTVYTTSGTKTATIPNAAGCDSVITINLTINQSTTGTDVISACNSYTWINGVTYTTSNNTATHNIVGGAVNGCDSLVTLNLTIRNSKTGTDFITACNSYTWINGTTYTTSNNTATHNIVGGAANGCDSLVTLNLTIKNSTTGTHVITACNSYTWINGTTYTTSNNTATHNIVGGAANGCDSLVTLNLTMKNYTTGTDVITACNSYTWINGTTYTASNNTATHNIVGGAVNGCDSLVTLNLTIKNSKTGTDFITACNSYTWINGTTYTTSNNSATHNIVGGAANGCDSLVTLNLTINNSKTGTDFITACNSHTWINGTTYTTSNNTATYNIVGGAANGCDSLVTLNLTINNSKTGIDFITACNSHTWINGTTYTTSNNTATHNIVGGAANGCDSLVTLNLTIKNSTTGTDFITACNSYTWINGTTYTTSNNTATYNIVGGAANGCDSLVTLNLTIKNSTTGTDAITACNSHTWINGTTYTTNNNTATHNIVGGAANGCDSLVTLNLTIKNSTTGTDFITACNSHTWINGTTYTTSNNTATHNIVGGAANGCDSLVTLNLTIKNSKTGTDVITACNSHTWINGITYTASNNTATFNIVGGAANGCDSLITLNLTVNHPTTSTIDVTSCTSYFAPDGQIYTTSGPKIAIIQNALGCDSMITINLTILEATNSMFSVSACDTYTAPDGQIYNMSGMIPAVIPNQTNGCDSVMMIFLTIKNSTSSSITISECASYTAPDGVIYTTSGTKTAIIPNAAGCDSVITIDLTIKNSTTSSITESACSSYTAPDGQVYTSSGTKTAIIPNYLGCDSVITIYLSIQNTSNAITVSECNTYTAPDGAVYNTSGIKTATIPNAVGCDSVITINLTIKNSSSATISKTECDSYTAPDGVVYTSSGQKTAIIPNAAGCDSTITINLTIKNSTSSTINESACSSYTAPDGLIYTSSGTKTAIIPNAAGCDSTITIYLSILNTTNSISVSECESYTAPDGIVYTTSGTKTATIPNAAGCDSIITINLSIHQAVFAGHDSISEICSNFMPTIDLFNYIGANYDQGGLWLDMDNSGALSGSILTPDQVIQGAYYNFAYVVNATSPCINDSAKVQLYIDICDKINETSKSSLKVYPNPFKDEFFITGGNLKENSIYEIFNAQGKIVLIGRLKSSDVIQTKELAPGMYLLKITNDSMTIHKTLIKE